MILFSLVTYYTSTLLASCYRSGDSVTGKRNYTYMDAVRSNLGILKSFSCGKKYGHNPKFAAFDLICVFVCVGGFKVKVCGMAQYLNLFGVSIGYTIAASISMM